MVTYGGLSPPGVGGAASLRKWPLGRAGCEHTVISRSSGGAAQGSILGSGGGGVGASGVFGAPRPGLNFREGSQSWQAVGWNLDLPPRAWESLEEF